MERSLVFAELKAPTTEDCNQLPNTNYTQESQPFSPNQANQSPNSNKITMKKQQSQT